MGIRADWAKWCNSKNSQSRPTKTASAIINSHNAEALQWCHNEHNFVSNHWRLGCLLDRLFRRRMKKTSRFRVTRLSNYQWLVDSLHKGPVTRKMSPFYNPAMGEQLYCSHSKLNRLGQLKISPSYINRVPKGSNLFLGRAQCFCAIAW